MLTASQISSLLEIPKNYDRRHKESHQFAIQFLEISNITQLTSSDPF